MAAKIVTVFGSGQSEENYPDYQKAVLVGRMLASAGFIICNGGYGGIMEATARGAKEVGGKTIGVTAKELKGEANRWIDQEEKVSTWRDRLFRLVELADAYVVFDGVSGTLTELFVVWEMLNKKLLAKPVVVFGKNIRELVLRVRQFSHAISPSFLLLAETPDEILKFLKK